MLPITIPASEDKWDPEKEMFVPGTEEWTLNLEHSLISISKWEEIYEKPFLGDGSNTFDKTPEELMTYIKCMTIYPHNVPDEVYDNLTKENLESIMNYIGSSRTATTISDFSTGNNKKKEIMTAERIYGSMAILRIPFSCEKWFLNKLLTLISVVQIDGNPDPKKMNAKEYATWRKAQNQARRAKTKKH